MNIDLNQLFIYARMPPASLKDFIEFWSKRYRYPNDPLYSNYINGPHTADSLLALFKWKIGNKLFASKLPLVKRHFISRRDQAKKLMKKLEGCPPRNIAEQFLETFKDSGAIWRIFWLHCWDTRFPIYDQHVHRAMTFIEGKQLEELGKFSNEKKVKLYLDRYLPFFDEFQGMDRRTVDQALWQFGKSLKGSGDGAFEE